MQGLIHIGFRYGNVVFKSPRDWFPCRMKNTEGFIAVFNCRNDYSESEHIVDMLKTNSVLQHLFVYAIKMFGSSGNFGL